MADNDATKPAAENILKQIQQGLEICAPVIFNLLAAVGAAGQMLQAAAENIGPHIAEPLAALARIDWADAKRRIEELPARSKDAMSLAAANGWFFSWSDGLQSVMELVEELGATKPDAIDGVMAGYYRKNLQFFANELTANHPERATVISAAVKAHQTSDANGYYLSIPVFIAQADGLLTEIANVKSAMMKARGKTGELQGSEALRKKLATDQKSLDLIHPILTLHNLDFMKSEAARQAAARASGQSFTALNRHQVMHGESWDYGTEVNSLKAFSFLVFVGCHLPMVLKGR